MDHAAHEVEQRRPAHRLRQQVECVFRSSLGREPENSYTYAYTNVLIILNYSPLRLFSETIRLGIRA